MTRDDLYAWLSAQDPDVLYCVVRSWNWSNGTWLLSWIASQPTCTRATAQRIFWCSEPESFVGADGIDDWERDVFDLCALVVRNWHAGLYAADPPRRRGDLLRARLGLGGERFRSDDGTWYAPDQIGFHDPANPVPYFSSYRRTEAGVDPLDLPWRVPDDLGQVQRDRRPSWDAYELLEGVPEEFVDLLQDETD